MLQQAQDYLKKYFGYTSFRKGQDQIIANIIAGKDTLGIMPTGGGKSICYQIPALIFPGITIVISPLISLMKDQTDTLTALGIPATFINSTLSQGEVNQRLGQADDGRYKLLYIAPERFESELFFSWIRSLPISMFAIDEAHCISQWGHDFRPSYQTIASVIEALPNRPIISAFTATATPEVIRDIETILDLKGNTFITGFQRENLVYSVVRGENKRDVVLQVLEDNPDQSGIIYASTRKEVQLLYDFLLLKGYRAGMYHGGMNEQERERNQDQFIYDEIQVMVATNAFGMGIDKSNVRFVIHYNLPKNMEAYVQEAGRAGRDGEPSQCILLFHPQDIQIQKFLIEQSVSHEERKKQEYEKLQIMVDYCHTQQCLSNYILQYFVETGHEECGTCSNCSEESELVDRTIEAQKVFSCIVRMQERYGVTMIAKVLKGSLDKKLLQFRLHHLSTYGLLKQHTEKEISDFIHWLVAEDYLMLAGGKFPIVKLRPPAKAVLLGQESVYRKVRKRKQVFAQDEVLFQHLRELRKQLAEEAQVPPYVIFADSTLREMCESLPRNRMDMLNVKGVGEVKYEKYGAQFLAVIQSYLQEHP